jgi:hypothetical protein
MNWGFAFWAALLLGPLLWFVRRAHTELQELFFLLTGHQDVSIYLFQILLLPGVVLHEFSHYLAARLLGVRVRKISLSPNVRGNNVQMGAVVMDQPDFVRGLLIGLAPLVLGTMVIVLIGHHIFDVGVVIQAARDGDGSGMVEAARAAFEVSDAWIWLYLLFAVSNAMLPSEADREFVGPTLGLLVLVVALVVLAGRGPDLVNSLAGPMETVLSLLMVAFGITLFVDVIFVGVILLLKGLVSLTTGRRLERGTD